jgi:hypothetical protein
MAVPLDSPLQRTEGTVRRGKRGFSSLGARRLPVEQITSDSVLKELKELRQHKGMTIYKVQQRAPCMQRLVATLDEADRRKLAPEDHHVAAYYTIQCAVDHAIGRPDLAHILRRTLNFAQEDNFLDKRRSSLMAEFFIQPKSYSRLEVEAYVQLAGVLIAADRSPCRDADAWPDSVNLEIKLVLDRQDDIRWLLTLLTLDKRPHAQEKISRQLINRLPNGQSAVRESRLFLLRQRLRQGNAVTIARYLIALTLLRLQDDGVLDTTTLGFSALYTLLLLRPIDASEAAILAFRRELEYGLMSKHGGFLPNMEFYQRKGRTLRVVADRMALTESTEGWRREFLSTDTELLAAMVEGSNI